MELSRDRLKSCQITADLRTQKKTFRKRSNIYYSVLDPLMGKYYEFQNLKIIVESPKMENGRSFENDIGIFNGADGCSTSSS